MMQLPHRRSGVWLILIGLAGVLFFWMTDHRYGWAVGSDGPVTIDAANNAFPGTLIGIAGSLIVLGIGFWLLTRKAT